MGADRRRRHFAQHIVRAQLGNRVLDIGCGPAHLRAHLPDVEYFGWEPNAAYVAKARKTYGDRGTFHANLSDQRGRACSLPVVIATVSAVLHHVDDWSKRGQARRATPPRRNGLKAWQQRLEVDAPRAFMMHQ